MRTRHLTLALGAVALLPTAGATSRAVADAPAPTASAVPGAISAQGMVGVNPTRVLDTRVGTGAAGPVGPGASIDVQVAGLGGVPDTGVGAVVLNVTVADPTAGGYVTAWPTGSARPNASNLNFVAGQTIPNLVIVKVGAGGKVSLYNAFGSTHLLADVSGYYTADSQLVATNPTRLLDTRLDGAAPSGTFTAQVAGQAGVPATGATAVVANVTVVDPTNGGFLTVSPTGEPRPNASNLNFERGETRPNLVIAKIGDEGKIDVYVSSGQAHVLIDVLGYVNTPPYMTELLDSVASSGDGYREVEQLDVDGVAYLHGLRLYRPVGLSATPRWTEYNLGRRWTTLSTTFAFDDNLGDAASNVRFRILGDGAVLADETLTFGRTAPVSVDVTGVLRVRFEATPVGSHQYTSPVFIDPRLSTTPGYPPAPDYLPLVPDRVLDTRTGNGAAEGRVLDGEVVDLVVAGRGGVPGSGVGAVVLNLTATDPERGGYVTAWPSGTPQPNASNVNFAAGATAPNLAVVPVGSNGRISLYVFGGPVHLIADVLGWFPGGVSTRPDEALLTELLDPVDWNVVAFREIDQLDAGGTSHLHSIRATRPTGLPTTPPTWVEYNLGRQWGTLRTTMTYDDDLAPADSDVRFRILGDGVVLAERTLTFGESAPVELDVTDVLRLRFEVTPIGGHQYTAPVFIDPELTR